MSGCSLGWLDPETAQRVDMGYLRGGTALTLIADAATPAAGPSRFEIRRYRGVVMRTIEDILGRRLGEPPPTIRAVHYEQLRFIGGENWVATAPPGFNQARYVFRDDHACSSSWVSVSNQGFTAELVTDRGSTAAGIALPSSESVLGKLVGESVAIRAGQQGEKQTLRLSTTRDPRLRLEVLTDWDRHEAGLVDTLTEAFQNAWDDGMNWRSGCVEPPTEANLRSALRDVLGRTSRPEGWAINLDRNQIDMDGGDTADVGVAIEAPMPGRGVFAIRAADVESPRQSVVTEPVEIVAV
jgi:hypothetical protein